MQKTLLASVKSKPCSHGAPHERHVTGLSLLHLKCVRIHALSLPLRPVFSDARFSLSELFPGSVDDSSLINAVQPPPGNTNQPFKLLFLSIRLLFFHQSRVIVFRNTRLDTPSLLLGGIIALKCPRLLMRSISSSTILLSPISSGQPQSSSKL